MMKFYPGTSYGEAKAKLRVAYGILWNGNIPFKKIDFSIIIFVINNFISSIDFFD